MVFYLVPSSLKHPLVIAQDVYANYNGFNGL